MRDIGVRTILTKLLVLAAIKPRLARRVYTTIAVIAAP
jgi:hypothetical protein